MPVDTSPAAGSDGGLKAVGLPEGVAVALGLYLLLDYMEFMNSIKTFIREIKKNEIFVTLLFDGGMSGALFRIRLSLTAGAFSVRQGYLY